MLSLRRFKVASNGGNLGRDKLSWAQELWDRVDAAVHDEMKRTLIARRFIPVVPVAPDALTVAADTINVNTGLTFRTSRVGFLRD
jgi:uncharacterized linocin/CFP29 family protein